MVSAADGEELIQCAHRFDNGDRCPERATDGGAFCDSHTIDRSAIHADGVDVSGAVEPHETE
jgi:hypothetical protein